MKKNMTLLLVIALFLTELSVANAVTVTHVFDDFDDGELSGWIKGRRTNEPLTISTEENGNRYLELESFGPRSGRHPDPDSKLNVNAGDLWAGDVFKGMKVLFADMMNLGDADIPMHVAFTSKDGFTAYFSKAINLPANGEWIRVAFNLTASNFHAEALNTDFFPDPEPFDQGVADISLLRFYSAEDGIDPNKMIAKIGIDNVGVSAVPVPAAVWLFLSGLLGLRGIAIFKTDSRTS